MAPYRCYLLLGVLGCLVAAAGCSDSVQEDRSINYSVAGESVAFQHGDDGVYLASADGKTLEKIFDSAGAVAVSSPLWSPIDRRLIFTSAHPVDPAPGAPADSPMVLGSWDANPDGRSFLPGEVLYTCWMRQESVGDAQSEPLPLFNARCNHSGYVAANLAVRWHPSGQKVLFIDQITDEKLALFEFDLRTRERRRAFELSASAMVFGYSPSGAFLSCTLSGADGGAERDGTWLFRRGVQPSDNTAWWHLPHSNELTEATAVAPLEWLRAAQPIWSSDETQFLFVTEQPRDDEPSLRQIFRGDPSSRTVERIYRSEVPVRDVHWHPRDERVGFVEGDTPLRGALRIVDATGSAIDSSCELPVRRFAGWDSDGRRLAFVSPMPLTESSHRWALLFPQIPAARDRVFLADDGKAGSATAVHDDVRISFPQWSPTQNQLSLWGTYAPTHRCWLSLVLPWSLPPGDPAAILDGETGELSWLAVNRNEQSQVGHYFLLKRDYERAWSWYEKGALDRPAPEALAVPDLFALLSREAVFQGPQFFEYYCLHKLGRTTEAEARLAEFRRSMSFDLERIGTELPGVDLSVPEAKQQLEQLAEFMTPVIQSAYMTEVFFSLNAIEDGVEFFEHQWQVAQTDSQKLASGLCLSQLIVASGDHAAYAEFATHRWTPVLEGLLVGDQSSFTLDLGSQGDLASLSQSMQQAITGYGAALSLLPLASHDFNQTLIQEQVRELLPVWQGLTDRVSWPVEIIVLAMLERLDEQPSASLQKRIAEHPLLNDELSLSTPQQVDERIEQLAALFHEL